MAEDAKKSFKKYMWEQTHGIKITGFQYKKLRRKWRKLVGYKSSAERVVETGHKMAGKARERFTKLLRRK